MIYTLFDQIIYRLDISSARKIAVGIGKLGDAIISAIDFRSIEPIFAWLRSLDFACLAMQRSIELWLDRLSDA